MDIQEWINEFDMLTTEAQRNDFDKRFRAAVAEIPEEEKGEFQRTFYNSALQNLKEAEEIIEIASVRKALEPVIKYISLSEIADKYFNKTRQWLYQKLNGNIVNGVPAKFTKEELNTLKSALNELSEDMRRVAQTI